MSFRKIFEKIAGRPWAVSIFLLLIFFAVNGYKYGWDDQHLEIPLLKSLIDPSLYPGDYYVQSLKENFSSFLYPLLAKIITVEQIPAAYFFLYLLSRYFFLFWMYKLWTHITGERMKGFICTLSFLYVVRVSELLYQTFSHQEFAFAIIFAGIYYFFKERFLLASLILGLSANIHALYSGFPMFYIFVYLLLNINRHGFKDLILAPVMFLAGAAPFIVWSFQQHLASYVQPDPAVQLEWLNIYLSACSHNFILPLYPFKDLVGNVAMFFNATQSFLLLIILYVLNYIFDADFRENKKAQAFCIGAFLLLVLTVIFTYSYPIRFFVDLNLRRNEQYLLFLLSGYTMLLIIKTIERGTPLMAFCFGILFTLLKFGRTITIPAVSLMLILLSIDALKKRQPSWVKNVAMAVLFVLMVPCFYTISKSFTIISHRTVVLLNTAFLWGFLAFIYFALIRSKDEAKKMVLRKSMIFIPLIVFFLQYTYYHIERVQIEAKDGGFWLLQRDWRDMQEYVRNNTPKDAYIMIPYDLDMDNFRIFSERKILCSERDKGIVGFDINAGLEWSRRREDIKSFKTALTSSISTAVQKGILKYKVDYIVFMRYAAPPKDSPLLKHVYTNTTVSLYKVLSNPYMDGIK